MKIVLKENKLYPSVKSETFLRSIWFVITPLLIVTLAGCGLHSPSHQASSYPPGWKDVFDNRDWDRESISHFLDIQLPDTAQDLEIEGQQGLVGSYGIYPTLTFSFSASPESAYAFVEHFCDGELHAGYDPRNAINLTEPAQDAVLIRGNRTIHYSRSDDTPQTIYGNRCARYDARTAENLRMWIEEVTLDTSDPDAHRVFYHLPFEANSGNAEEYYPRAQTVAPFGDQFRFNVTGFTEDSVLNYSTICIETSALALVWDHFAFNPDIMPAYAGATVAIYIDDVQQPPARISEPGLLLRPADSQSPADKWQYCLDANWERGTHTMRVEVDPLEAEPIVLEWGFTVSD